MKYGRTRATRSWLLKEAARQRSRMTPAEAVMWKWLQAKQADWVSHHVRLQYILDFYNTFLCLAVEVDGGYHTLPKIVIKDRMRDSHLLDDGVVVCHVTNEQVFDGTAMPIVHSMVLKMVELKLRFGDMLGYHIRRDSNLRFTEGFLSS